MANSAFNHSPTIVVPGSSTNTALVKWSGTGADTFTDSTILVGATTMGLAADTDLLTFGNGTLAITGAVTDVTTLTASGAVTGGTLVGTVTTATQGSITSAANLATVGTIGTGVWNGTAIVQAYIGAEAINESKLQVSNGPTNGQVLTARSGNTGGMTWEAAGGGGIDGTGVANKLAFWSDTDTLTQVATLQWNSSNHSLQLTRAGNVQIDMTPTGGSSVPYAISARTDGSLRFTNDTAGRIDMFIKSTGNVEFSNSIYIGKNNGSVTNKTFGFHSKNTQSVSTTLAYIITAADDITTQGALIFVAGRESSGSTKKFYDLLMHNYRDTSSSPTVISSTDANGASGRTYDQNQSGLRLRMASGTYDVAILCIQAPNVE